ncbi:hypothetical protein BGZ83_001325 [Gryganskiella cystojenkinii]|nr:hypothetical protein BGZ83_001325 [Gryganskiella cystojenkinii]
MVHNTRAEGLSTPGSDHSGCSSTIKPQERSQDSGLLISLKQGGHDTLPGTSTTTPGKSPSSEQLNLKIEPNDDNSRQLRPPVPMRNFDPFQSLFEDTFLPRATAEETPQPDGPPRAHEQYRNLDSTEYHQRIRGEDASIFSRGEQHVPPEYYDDRQGHEVYQLEDRSYYSKHEDEAQQEKRQKCEAQRVDPDKKALIDDRISRERPNRTLFVRNLDYEASLEDVRALFVPYGEIKEFYSLIDTRGMVFIKYFDIRAAEHAKKETHGMELDGRSLDVHFSLPKDKQYSKDCTKDDNNANFGSLNSLTVAHALELSIKVKENAFLEVSLTASLPGINTEGNFCLSNSACNMLASGHASVEFSVAAAADIVLITQIVALITMVHITERTAEIRLLRTDLLIRRMEQARKAQLCTADIWKSGSIIVSSSTICGPSEFFNVHYS